MAITVGDDTIGTGDTVCQRCGWLFFRQSGCENCRETARASAKLAQTAPPKRVSLKPEELWWLAVPNGTPGYPSAKDAAERRNAVTWVPRGRYKLPKTRQREFNGYKSLIEIPDNRHPRVWINESPDDGVYRRKSMTDADQAMEKFHHS